MNNFSKSCLAIAISQSISTSADAATITVRSNTDAGGSPACSLREAIVSINTAGANQGDCASYTTGSFGSNDTINFNLLFTPNVINLTQGELKVNQPITINGPGEDKLSIDAGGNSRVFHFNADEITGYAETVSLNNVTVRNGSVSGNGGGVYAFAVDNLTINNTTIENSSATVFGGGLRISYTSFLDISDSTISSNSSGASGGGISFRVIGSNASNSISRSTISNNTTRSRGGGIYSFMAASLTINNSTISHNRNLIGDGGGIYIRDGKLVITQSTLSENTAASEGGGINVGNVIGTPTVFINSTISNNFSYQGGGGINVNSDGEAIIIQSTITSNTAPPSLGGGIAGSFGDIVINKNSVVASNFGDDCDSNVTFSNPIWVGDSSCGKAADGDPKLNSLADNGGFTKTHAPKPGSGLIDTGNTITCNALSVLGVDQRGEPRGVSTCFMGAVEGIVDDSQFFTVPLGNGKAVIFSL